MAFRRERITHPYTRVDARVRRIDDACAGPSVRDFRENVSDIRPIDYSIRDPHAKVSKRGLGVLSNRDLFAGEGETFKVPYVSVGGILRHNQHEPIRDPIETIKDLHLIQPLGRSRQEKVRFRAFLDLTGQGRGRLKLESDLATAFFGPSAGDLSHHLAET